MAHVVAPNLRGKGISETKFTKSGDPKRAGNWSVETIRRQSLQSRDYPVWIKTYQETGVQILMVGECTPLSYLMGEQIATAVTNDPHFNMYRRSGTRKVGAKEYDAYMSLTKFTGGSIWLRNKWGIYREEIYTEFDFDYQFPEY